MVNFTYYMFRLTLKLHKLRSDKLTDGIQQSPEA